MDASKYLMFHPGRSFGRVLERTPIPRRKAKTVRTVQLADVKTDSMERVITVEGILRALDQSAVTPKISAPVSKFLVNRGDHVKAGQLIAVLESKDLHGRGRRRQGTMDQSAASLRNTESASVPDEVVKAQTDVLAAKETMDAAKRVLDSRTAIACGRSHRARVGGRCQCRLCDREERLRCCEQASGIRGECRAS